MDHQRELLDVTSLKPHPLNALLYAPPGGEEFDELKRSMQDHGQLADLEILPDRTIISGHRRLEAAKAIGLAKLWCVTRDVSDELEIRKLIIEHNRYRRKTFSELMNEARELERIESEWARRRQGQRTDLGVEYLRDSDAGRVRDKVGAAIGVSGVTYKKMSAIYDAAKQSDLIATKVESLNRGETSIESVFKLVNELKKPVTDFNPKVYDIWTFGGLNPKYGNVHPGGLPGDFIENLLHYFTVEGETVVDPFAGGGITVDVCRAMGRKCYASDIAPVREDIFQWDIAQGYPKYEVAPSLVFLDPPYWNMVAEDYVQESASSLDFVGFLRFLVKLSKDTAEVIKPGGVVAAIIMKQKFRLPEGLPFVDWPFIWYQQLCEAGLIPLDRIACPWPTSIWQAFHVEKAKEDRRILPLVGDLLIMLKPIEQGAGSEYVVDRPKDESGPPVGSDSGMV